MTRCVCGGIVWFIPGLSQDVLGFCLSRDILGYPYVTVTTVGWPNGNNNNSRMAQQINNVKDFSQH